MAFEPYKNQAVFLRNLREKTGLMQTKLARLIKVSCTQQVWNIENGKCPIPLKWVIPLSRVFKIDPMAFWDCYHDDMKEQWLRKTGIKKGNGNGNGNRNGN